MVLVPGTKYQRTFDNSPIRPEQLSVSSHHSAYSGCGAIDMAPSGNLGSVAKRHPRTPAATASRNLARAIYQSVFVSLRPSLLARLDLGVCHHLAARA